MSDLEHKLAERRRQEDAAWAMKAEQDANPTLAARCREGALFLNKELRNRLAGEQGWRCCYCGCRMDPISEGMCGWERSNHATFEHIRPRTFGGKDVLSNLVIACYACNNYRGNRYFPVHDKVLAEAKRK